MNIPFVDLKTQYRMLQKDINNAILRTLNTTHFIQGEDVIAFENEFAEYVGAKHSIGVNSGTDALVLGIRALGLTAGDEVIIPANTFIATALAASANGLKPVFVDIDDTDCGINIDDLTAKITSKTKAIIVVHLYGQPDKLEEIQKIIKKSGKQIYLIEDACQAHGAIYKKKKVGNYGIFAAFSFYPGKNLGAYGDGGALITNDAKLAKKIKQYREYGQKKKYVHEILGTNTRLDTIQAAILRVKLPHLDAWNNERQLLARQYTEDIQKKIPQIIIPREYSERKSVYHLYVIRVKRREKLLDYLQSQGINVLIHYPIPLHLQKAYQYLGYKKGSLKIAESVSKQIISLPIYPELTKKMIAYTVSHIEKFYSL